eukprot:CCRYP_006202-RB/>CCRYP_006202-RB protein AED:0.07 eAED:0.07 QI:240/1/1/1/1/1/4/100/794
MNLTDTNVADDVSYTPSSTLPHFDDYPNGNASDNSSTVAGPYTQQAISPEECYENVPCDATNPSYDPSDYNYNIPPPAASDADVMPPPPPGYPASSMNNANGAAVASANIVTSRPPNASTRTTSYPAAATKFATAASNPAAINRNVPSSTFTKALGHLQPPAIARRPPPAAHTATSAAHIRATPTPPASSISQQGNSTDVTPYATPSVYSSDMMSSPSDNTPPSLSPASSAPGHSLPIMTPSSQPEHVVSSVNNNNNNNNHSHTNNNHTNNNPSKKKCCQLLRRGKWTNEEEAYASKLINEFKSGLLPLTDGTTLRNFLSKLLNCDPMRISKKFVGNNCIGKQVFRRRGADINRLTPEQMRQTALELSELEQRFFDRVATTNRVKPPGVTTMSTGGVMSCIPSSYAMNMSKNVIEEEMDRPPTPPWLKPPAKYQSSRMSRDKVAVIQSAAATSAAAAVATTTMTTRTNQYIAPRPKKPRVIQRVAMPTAPMVVDAAKSDTERVMESMERSSSGLGQVVRTPSSHAESISRTESALEQLARTASAAKFVEDIVNGDSGLGDVQIKGTKLSSLSLQGSFQALMSLDMDSVENLVQLSSANLSSEELNKLAESYKRSGSSSFKSSSRMESFIKSLSNANLKSGLDSNAALSSLFQNIQNSMNDPNSSSTNIFDDEKFLNRIESSTGFSKLRAHNGLTGDHHSSVEDFLSLMTSGDIPHEDANMLNLPLQKVMGSGSLASKLSQHQLLKLASRASLAKLAQSNTSLSESLSDLAAGYGSATGNSALKNKRKRGDTTVL